MPTHFNTQNSYSEESWGFSITLIPWIQSVWRCSDGLPLNHFRNWANTHSVFPFVVKLDIELIQRWPKILNKRHAAYLRLWNVMWMKPH